MSYVEAKDLALDIRIENHVRLELYQVANGEWTLRWNSKFIWDAEDWQRLRNMEQKEVPANEPL
jgi:hypothetical protein